MKVLLATQKPFAADAVIGIREILEGAGHQVSVLENYDNVSALSAAAIDVDALIVRSDLVTSQVMEDAPKLKVIVRAGAGYDNIDIEEASRRGIVVMNTPGQNSNAVAELAIAMMIYMNRAQFTPETGSEIKGKTIGIHAFGNVGRLVAAKAGALGMNVMAIDPYLTPEQICQGGAMPAGSVEELYSSCDIISVHMPATAQTVGSIGYDLIRMMPEGALLVNTARKEVIDEEGLLKAMNERQDLKYASDIAPSNLQALKQLCGLRVFTTPRKMGAQTSEANVNAGLAAARHIVSFFSTGDIKYKVNI